jgi:tRNA threonylcarbamoyladenosine biosynthesis protein TsaB
MKLLAVDTALGACSAAVLSDGAILASCFEIMDRGHAERLAPMVRDVMAEADMEFASLSRLAVTTGPGTFTGQRVGIAFMRGLRIALKKPLVGVTTLECMIAAALGESGAGAALAVHDARRNEVYCAATANGRPILPPCLMLFEDMVVRVRNAIGETPLAVAGTAADKTIAALGGTCLPTRVRQPDAVWLGRIAGRLPEPDSVPQPLYLREPDARLPVP